jgi:GH24 family phage-related lysozyme (muramidase)
MSAAVDICYARLNTEEGRKPFAYNDATAKRVTCQPVGNLTIAVGVNLEVGLDDEEIDWLSKHRLAKRENELVGFAWYRACDPVRQSVLLDIAFNQGTHGLLHYPLMIAAISRHDWEGASAQCHVADAELDKSRYAPLRRLLATGGQ